MRNIGIQNLKSQVEGWHPSRQYKRRRPVAALEASSYSYYEIQFKLVFRFLWHLWRLRRRRATQLGDLKPVSLSGEGDSGKNTCCKNDPKYQFGLHASVTELYPFCSLLHLRAWSQRRPHGAPPMYRRRNPVREQTR